MQFRFLTKTLSTKYHHQTSKPLQLKEGQIFYGRVQRIFPNQLGEIRIGSENIVAHIQAPLVTGKGYWFQAITKGANLQLRILQEGNDGNEITSSNQLLSILGLNQSKTNRTIAQFFIEEHIPLTKQQMIEAVNWFSNNPNLKIGFEVIKYMKTNQLPFNYNIFQSFMAVEQGPSIFELLSELQKLLLNTDLSLDEKQLLHQFKEWQKLTQQLLRQKDISLLVRNFTNYIKQSMDLLGIGYEGKIHQLHTDETIPNNIKSILINMLQNSSSISSEKTKKILQQMLFRLNGLQLLSLDANGMATITLELPIFLENKIKGMIIQWSGKKTKKGQIDPNFCHILFSLDLAYLKKILILMQIQNRVVTISFYHEVENLKAMAEPLLSHLKTRLQEWDYHLSGFYFKPYSIHKNTKQHTKQPIWRDYSSEAGVDIKI